jgi:phosphohistidine swiveling domain-containing protein
MAAENDFNPETGEWNASLSGDYLWSNTNFGEAITDVMTPLTWSVLQFTLDDWVFLPGFPTVGNICGYPYLNISIFMTIFRSIGRSRQDLLDFTEGTLYMNLPEEVEIPLIPITWQAFFPMFQHSLRIQLKQKQGASHLPTYLATNPGWFAQMREKLNQESTGSGLASLWQDEIRPHIKRGVWTVLGTVTSSTDYTTRLRQELNKLVDPDHADILFANISDPTGLLPSLGPVVGLSLVARGEMSHESYLERYGHRGPHEFEISAPRPVEDPEWLNAQVERFRASPVDVEELLAKQKASFDNAWESFRSQYPKKANSIRRRLEESARRARLREQARSEYVRDRWMIRLFALRAGELSGLGDDIFFLTLDEALGLLAGDRSATGYIPKRKELYQRYRTLPHYPSLIRGHFDAFQWANDPERRSDIFEEQVVSRGQSLSAILKGSPGSAGQAEGVVRVIDHPRNGDKMQNGEVLVAVQTDVAWTLLFPRAAAVVTDIGAPLSHAAIVARELGIPAVVGCGNATARLKTGDRVRVDGSRGVVEILEPGSY